MRTTNVIPKPRDKDQGWVFLAEHSTGEFIAANDRGDGSKAGPLLRTMRDLGIPPECLNKMVRTLIEFADQMIVHFDPCKGEYPMMIRLYCQKKLKDEAISAKTSRPYETEQALDQASFIHHPSTKMNGGWGYFLIERGGDVSAGCLGSLHKTVDLYLYKEGE